ncbi:MAG: hypothetical protein AAF639_10005 [Chloroflexota bacterium]
MKDLITHYASLSVDEIRSERAGQHLDNDLLDVWDYFDDEDDIDRSIAILELVLQSPEIDSELHYDELYDSLVGYLVKQGDVQGALRWGHMGVAYSLKSPDLLYPQAYRSLAQVYLASGDFDTALAMMTRNLQSEPEDTLNHHLLGSHLPYYGLASLAVEVLDRGIVLSQAESHLDFLVLPQGFDDLHQHAITVSNNEESRMSEISPDVLQAFREALALTQRPNDSYRNYLAPVDQVITGTDGAYQTVAEAILDPASNLGKVLAPDLLRICYEHDFTGKPAIGRALDLLRQLQANNIVALDWLAEWLETADADWLQTCYSQYIGKTGGYTHDELIAIAQGTGPSNNVRDYAVRALLERMQEDVVPTDEVITLLRHLLTRPEAGETVEEEQFIAYLISQIAEAKLIELYPEIEAAFNESRVDVRFASLAFAQERLGMPVTAPRGGHKDDAFYLPLTCTVCGRQRPHHVQHITVDDVIRDQQVDQVGADYDGYTMDREITCPKCGAHDQYKLSYEGKVMLELYGFMPWRNEEEGRLVESRPGTGSDRYDLPYVYHMNASMPERFVDKYPDYPMQPLEGIKLYQDKIAAEPDNWHNYVRLGYILRTVYRSAEALEVFTKAFDLAGEQINESGRNTPAYLNLTLAFAMAQHDFGDYGYAEEFYSECQIKAEDTLRVMAGDLEFDVENGFDPESVYLPELSETESEEWEGELIKVLEYANVGRELLRRRRPSQWANEHFDIVLDPPKEDEYRPKSSGRKRVKPKRSKSKSHQVKMQKKKSKKKKKRK